MVELDGVATRPPDNKDALKFEIKGFCKTG